MSELTGVSLVKASFSQHKATVSSWDKTGAFLLAHKDAILPQGSDGKLPEGADATQFKKTLTINFGIALQKEAGHLLKSQEIGISGKLIDILDKEGLVKWRSIAATENIIKSLSSIWNNMLEFGFDNLFVKGKLKGKTGLEQEYKKARVLLEGNEPEPEKTPETVQDAIKRASKIIRDNIGKATSADVALLDIEISAIYAAWDEVRGQLVKKG